MIRKFPEKLRKMLERGCERLGVPIVPVLDPVVSAIDNYFHYDLAMDEPGRQHSLSHGYFDRIGAMQYTLAHDDGQLSHDLESADIVLVGVSRTSKTPTSMYLANRGYKTANIPLVMDQKIPEELKSKNNKTCIVGLVTDPERLADVRRNRVAIMRDLHIKEYTDLDFIKKSSEELVASRPTAINLQWAVHRMNNKLSFVEPGDLFKVALNEAKEICKEDEGFCESIGKNGLNIIEDIYNKKKDTVNILTHCNAGWLATIDWGTATSPIYHAHKKGIPIHVWVDETRPRNQGANLTSYELNEEDIPNTIIADNTGGILMQRGQVDMCIVGTDRTLSNGDVCNKIGTYLKALAAHDNKIPFYVALPSSTIDWNLKNSKDIPIEERDPKELSHVDGINKDNKVDKVLIYPEKSKSLNLAFDVTPAKYVTALITEKGICEASTEGLNGLFKN